MKELELEVFEIPKDIVENARNKWKNDVVQRRGVVLKAMDNAVRGMNDEYAIETWLMVGVPDEASDEDYISIAEDHEEYADIVKVFARIVSVYAKEDF